MPGAEEFRIGGSFECPRCGTYHPAGPCGNFGVTDAQIIDHNRREKERRKTLEEQIKPLMDAIEATESDDQRDTRLPVLLQPFEWHLLLKELESSMRIINRDRENITILYEKISTQLNNDRPVRFVTNEDD